jgi:sec-independent protein translocase protein TatA
MGPLGVPEMIAIFLLALLLFGPKKLPEIGRTIGKAVTEFRKASSELKETFNREVQNLERETDSIKTDVANEYQYENYNYDYSYETPSDGVTNTPEADSAANPSSESASAPQGAELTPEGAPEGTIAQGSEITAESTPASAESSQPAHGEGTENTAAPAENKA